MKKVYDDLTIINLISVLAFQIWWVFKSKNFGQKSTYSNEIIVFCECNEIQMLKLYFQFTFSNFLSQRSIVWFFWLQVSNHAFKKKICPIFDELSFIVQSNLVIRNVMIRNKLVLRNNFPWPNAFLLHNDKDLLALRNNFRVYVDFWPKMLLFRTHHLWNSTTEMTLATMYTVHTCIKV